jgi:hypothetical protein
MEQQFSRQLPSGLLSSSSFRIPRSEIRNPNGLLA